MKRLKLIPSAAALDKETLFNYSQGVITKQQAMKEITAHNGSVEKMDLEYFDYLARSTGFYRREE